MPGNRLKVLCILLMFLVVTWISARAQENELKEYQVKAAFLYNFTKFVTWPQNTFQKSDSPFVFEILGDCPIRTTIKPLERMKVNGHSVVIRYAKNKEDLQPCHVLFLCKSEKENVDRILERVINSPVLTVSDIDGFVNHGGIIEFIIEDEKLRFLINQEAADRAGIRISFQLLALAKKVFKK